MALCSEPIVIVGTGCRFAGGASSPSKLWDLCCKAPDLSQDVPSTRFSKSGFHHPDGEHHGTTNAGMGYFLEQDHRVFDAAFFNITPKEAEAVDPQHRMLLEVVFEAMESAGYSLDQYSGKPVSVYSGVMTDDHSITAGRDVLLASQYHATGNSRAIMSNRISYFFNFQGPSMTIDTACSASLVALHQAVGSLRSGESEMAVVTGANLLLAPEQYLYESSLHMLSPTGKSRMWDASADGYARGEGIVAVIVKRLSQALKDGDRIISVIRETAVNSDGRTKGITMPSPEAQEKLIRQTYRNAGLNARDAKDRCQYFEAHGTGTQVGDQREASAIHAAFFGGDEETATGTLLVGSVKTLIGHTEGAAGLAGVMKVALAMEHGLVPPNLHFVNVNPRVEPFCTKLTVPTALTAWPEPPAGQPRRGSVNSFGFGGTNAHAILEQYNASYHNAMAHTAGGPECRGRALAANKAAEQAGSVALPLVVSARSQKSLLPALEAMLEYIQTHPDVSIEEVAWSLIKFRTAHTFRHTVCADTRDDLLSELTHQIETGRQSPATLGTRPRVSGKKARILGVFTGQGAQWPQMGERLFAASHVYQQSILYLEEVLEECPHPPSWSLRQELEGADAKRMTEAAISQPLCTAVQIALVDLLTSLGVSFHTVVGHSSGEIAAAYAAGVLTARDAMLIAYYRGTVAHLAGGAEGQKGMMLAAGLTRVQAEDMCNKPAYKGRLWVAASNAPSTVTLSGDADAVKQAKDELVADGKFARALLVDTAYHSPHMAKAAEEYLTELAGCGIKARPPSKSTKWVSSVTGGEAEPTLEDLSGPYWRDNMANPVLFHEAVLVAMDYAPFDCAIEVGPHAALKGPATQTMKAISSQNVAPYCGVLDRSKPDTRAFADFLGFLWVHLGPEAVAWDSFAAKSGRPSLVSSRLLDLPSYQWEHSQVYWRTSRLVRKSLHDPVPHHELLGKRTADDNEFELRWRNILKLETVQWMEHHKFQGQALLPASGYCVMALDAGRAVAATHNHPVSVVELCDVQLLSGITLEPGSSGTEVLFALNVQPWDKDSAEIRATFTISSAPALSDETRMKLNVFGSIRVVLSAPDVAALPKRVPVDAEAVPVKAEAFYSMMESLGLGYSGPFKALETMERRYNHVTSTLCSPHDEDTTTLMVSPAMLDACFHSAFAAFSSPGDKSLWTSFLPRAIACIRFNLAACRGEGVLTVDADITDVQTNTSKNTAARILFDVEVSTAAGDTMIQVEDLAITSFQITRPEDDQELYLTTTFNVDPDDAIVAPPPALAETQLPLALRESFERVLRFTLPADTCLSILRALNLPQCTTPWVHETEDTLKTFVMQSPHFQQLQQLASGNPEAVTADLVMMLAKQASEMHEFGTHVANVVQQVAHRYTQMNVLSLTESEESWGRYLVHGLGDLFASLTFGATAEENARHFLPLLKHTRAKIVDKPFDWTTQQEHENAQEQQPAATRYDMVVVSAALIDGPDASTSLETIRARMTPGGFLVLLGSQVAAASRPASQWVSVLDSAGFAHRPANAVQVADSGCFAVVSKAEARVKHVALHPFLSQEKLLGDVVVMGGAKHGLGQRVKGLLEPVARGAGLVESWEHVTEELLEACSVAVFLCDLDEPVMPRMSAQTLDFLRRLLTPGRTVLWATHDALAGNPDLCGTLGFVRTLIHEIPNLRMQVLDLDQLHPSASAELIAGAVVRLDMKELTDKAAERGLLWTHEYEVFVRDGRRCIPRILPFKAANARFNALRRNVVDVVNTHQTPVEIRSATSDAESAAHTVHAVEGAAAQGEGLVCAAVHCSSVGQLELAGTGDFVHAFVGQNVEAAGDVWLGLCDKNASRVAAREEYAHRVPAGVNEAQLLGAAVRYVVALDLVSKVRGATTVVLVEPDDALLYCVKQLLTARGVRTLALTTSPEASACSASTGKLFCHPELTSRKLSLVLPAKHISLFDAQPGGTSVLMSKIQAVKPKGFTCLGSVDDVPRVTAQQWDRAVGLACTNADALQRVGFNSFVSAAGLVSDNAGADAAFRCVQWQYDRVLASKVGYVPEGQLLRGDRTYLLVGMTKDMGQSLCTLFAEHGAENLVLVSRNPNKAPKWKAALEARGVTVRIESLDVTNREHVKAFKAMLDEEMPPMGGVINGAMVLDDRVFTAMTEDCWHRVLRPKTIGSKNLDAVFRDPGMDFFIMTSSFAGSAGHMGQSNYACANMFMNGLAANRRRRGLAGSAINIGVVVGLGLLLRGENESVLKSLEREGYPPISERALHHLFLEGIVAGRPVPGQVQDVVTGIERYSPHTPFPQPWHLDARFSHFTLPKDKDPFLAAAGDCEGKESVKVRMAKAAGCGGADAARDVLVEAFLTHLENLLGVAGVARQAGLAELGVDSLMAVDLRNWFFKTLAKDMPVMKILQAKSIDDLCADAAADCVAL